MPAVKAGSSVLRDAITSTAESISPALEPITLARKPLRGTVAENVLTHGTGGINVDGCRVDAPDHPGVHKSMSNNVHEGWRRPWRDGGAPQYKDTPSGRFPANLIHDGSEEVLALFPVTGPAKSGNRGIGKRATQTYGVYKGGISLWGHDDSGGSAARFFYCAKADRDERERHLESVETAGQVRNDHPTVKPLDLMKYLVRLVTPPGGTVLDPFSGSGTTLLAAKELGCCAVGIEREERYCEIAAKRLAQGVLL